ncbi:MAG: alpha/beta fold hydrolase [Crocinitomicaceae bacterium]|nr:alpha/beta fold hydrolase [Crocinitomicaceae bacterium]
MKQRLLKYLKRGIILLASIYVLACILVYFFQEKLLFHPEAVPKTEVYSYDQEFTEKFYKVSNGVELNTLLFKSDSVQKKRKLVFYIHGNAGNLSTAGGLAPVYTDQGYDCFLYDYRGYGKSDGSIDSEESLFADAQILYDKMALEYDQEDIILVGYSMGTGIAAWLASKNAPSKLILQAPYRSVTDIMKSKYPMLPTFLLRYPLETNERLKETKCPIYIFHGDKDRSIPYSSSEKLKKEIKRINLTRLGGLGHNGFMSHPIYRSKMKQILSN